MISRPVPARRATVAAPPHAAHPRAADEPKRYLGRRIRLSETSGRPVYRQLADQLEYLIATGELEPETRLPSARHLADNLSINRNTVLSAYALLRRDRYAKGNRGGGTVVLPLSRSRDAYRDVVVRGDVLDIVEQMVSRALGLGVTPEQLVSLVASHVNTREHQPPLRVCFVECNRQSLSHFVGPIEREFGVRMRPLLLDDLEAAHARGDFRDADCVVSTFYHLTAVRRFLRDLGVEVEVFAIGVRPHVSVLEKLERLPRPATVGVVYFGQEGDGSTEERLRRMAETIEQTNLRDVKVRQLLLPARPEASVFSGVTAVVVRSESMSAARRAIPAGVEVIEFINDLDSASRRFLGEVFNDLRLRRARSMRARTSALRRG
ncbi:MAG: GntR family transcriptional regulator [Candidatus Limnocylindria bacterium]